MRFLERTLNFKDTTLDIFPDLSAITADIYDDNVKCDEKEADGNNNNNSTKISYKCANDSSLALEQNDGMINRSENQFTSNQVKIVH